MATVKHYLREYRNKNGEQQVYQLYSHQGERDRKPTGISIHSRYWDVKKQLVKSNSPKADEYNAVLKKIRAEIENLVGEAIFRNENPNTELINDKFRIKEQKAKTFFELYDQFIDDHRNQLKPKRIQKYITTRNHLLVFEKSLGEKLLLEGFDIRRFLQFEDYLIDEAEVTHNTVVGYVKVLKRFLHYMFELKLLKNEEFRKVSVVEKEPQVIFLTEEELQKWLDFKPPSQRLEEIKDIFLFQSYTGQRYGDIAAMRKEDIKGSYWHLLPQKDEDSRRVPLSPPAKQILNKYSYELPGALTQKMNIHIKRIAEMAGINDLINKYYYRGRKKFDNYIPKFEALTTHAAKRTFITLSLMRGMKIQDVKEVTGNKTWKSFDRYVKIAHDHTLKSMKKTWG